MEIKVDDLTNVQTIALIELHLNGMAANTPVEESRHALGIEKLKDPSITLYTAWLGDEIMGCGALKQLSQFHGELKSMRTKDPFLKQGVGQAILTHIIQEARARGMNKISLETGTAEPFLASHRLYKRLGFEFCAPFEQYKEDPNSVFMSLEL